MLDRDPSVTDDLLHCALCGEEMPGSYALYRESVGPVCWFCQTDEEADDPTFSDDDIDEEDEEEEEWEEYEYDDDWDDD